MYSCCQKLAIIFLNIQMFHNQKCIKPAFVAATADCEGVNKAVFCSLKDEIEQIGQIQNLHY